MLCAAAIACGFLITASAPASQGVVGFFGGAGSGAGQFTQSSGPGGIAINRAGSGGADPGDSYVVDPGNNRVQQFTSTGTFIRAFGLDVGGSGVNVCASSCLSGTASSSAAAMSDPAGIAVDQASGQVFLTDQGNRRIDVFSATGAFEGAFGWGVDTGAAAFEFCTTLSGCQDPSSAGGAAGQFGPSIGSPAVNPVNGDLLVADPANSRVDEFDVTGDPATGAAFVRAYGFDVVASGPDQAGTGFEVCDFAANPADVCQAGSGGSAGGQFASGSPRRVAVDSLGDAYLLDNENARVQKFDSDGDLLASFAAGIFSGFPAPSAIAVDPATDHVLVLKYCYQTICPGPETSFGQRILELDPAGFLLDSHLAGAGLFAIQDIAAGTAGRIYASYGFFQSPGVLILGSPPVPPSATIDPVTIFGATTATFTGLVNPTGLATGYRFEYSSDGTHWTKVSATDVPAGSGSSEVVATQSATALEPSTPYRVRLVATKSFGAGSATSSEETFTTLDSAPSVLSTSFSAITSDSAWLEAEIDPNSQPSTYRFQYGKGDCASNPCTSVPMPEANAGSGSIPVSVSYPLAGLDPDATYHFRVVASNATGTTAGADRTFRTFATPSPHPDGEFPGQGFLPEGRAWEMVSPAQKSGADVLIDTARFRAAQSEGSAPMAAMFSSRSLFAGALAGANATDYLSQRTKEPGTQGWATHGLFPAQEGMLSIDNFFGAEPLYLAASPDLGKAVFRAYSPLPGTPEELEGAQNLYLRGDPRSPAAGAYELLSACTFACTSISGGRPAVVGASADFSSVLFESGSTLSEDAPTPGTKLYKAAHGTLANVGYVPPSPASACTGTAPSCLPSSAVAGTGNAQDSLYTPHVLSEDGTRAFFTVPWGGSFTAGDLYLRDDRGSAGASDDTTSMLNASERTSADAPQPATYWDAASDGTRAFFTSKSALSDDAPIGATEKLYAWSLAADGAGHHLTYLSADQEPADGLGTVRGTLGAGADGSRLYFAAAGQLLAGEPLPDGALGIYLWREESGVAYVGEIGDSADAVEDLGGSAHSYAYYQLGARVTPNGRYLLISLREPPFPGGPDHGYCPQDGGSYEGTKGCRQLYLYDAASGKPPLCISCPPEGLEPSTPAYFSTRVYAANTVTTNYLNRAISDDGRYVFFSTAERLVAADVNSTTDAYVYDVQSARPSLLSSGESDTPSYFLDASADGRDAFFATRERLSGWDFDANLDVYDARVGGGLPEPPPPPPPSCQGDSCQPPTDPPAALHPASAELAGKGAGRGNCRAKAPRRSRCKKPRRRAAHRGRARR